MTVAQLLDADLTKKQTAAVRETVEHGGVATIDEIADGADISESTVRRTCDKLGQVIEIAAGKVRPADRVVAEKLRDVFNSIDQVIEQGKRTLRGLAGRGEFVEEDSPLGKWARRYAVDVDSSTPEAVEITVNLGELTEWQAIQIIRAGRKAADAVGPLTHDQYVKSRFWYTDRNGNARQKGFGRFGHRYHIS